VNIVSTNPNLWLVAAAMFAALAVGTAVRLAGLGGAAEEVAKDRLDSLKTWWVLAILVVAAAVVGRAAASLLFAVFSLLSLREFARLSRELSVHRRLLIAGYGLIPLSYLWIALGWPQVFVVFLPLATLLLASAVLVVAGRTEGFVQEVSRFCFAVLLTAYCLGYAVLLFTLPEESNSVAGVPGWFLFLVLLTDCNDIAQALIGRNLGKRKITPRVSPNKTWEGFLGGVLTSALLAVVLSHWLTPFAWLEAAAAGATIAVTGFFGDLNVSAIKRDAGVKDASRLLPGQGGALDRVDSLTFSAPAFYYLVLWSI